VHSTDSAVPSMEVAGTTRCAVAPPGLAVPTLRRISGPMVISRSFIKSLVTFSLCELCEHKLGDTGNPRASIPSGGMTAFVAWRHARHTVTTWQTPGLKMWLDKIRIRCT